MACKWKKFKSSKRPKSSKYSRVSPGIFVCFFVAKKSSHSSMVISVKTRDHSKTLAHILCHQHVLAGKRETNGAGQTKKSQRPFNFRYTNLVTKFHISTKKTRVVQWWRKGLLSMWRWSLCRQAKGKEPKVKSMGRLKIVRTNKRWKEIQCRNLSNLQEKNFRRLSGKPSGQDAWKEASLP